MEIVAYFENMIYDSPNFKVLGCSTNDESASLIPQRKTFARKEKYGFSVVLKDCPITLDFDKSHQYIFYGEWKTKNNRTSFEAYSYDVNFQNTKRDIMAFLTGFNQIGTATAKKIYDHFQEKTFEVLETDIERIYEVPKISKRRLEGFIAEYKYQRNFRTIVEYFSKFSLSINKIKKIYDKYKEDSILTMQTNPFELSETNCISFAEANAAAIDLKVELNSGERQKQGLIYVMQLLFRPKGDLFFKIDEVLNITYKFLNKNVPKSNAITVQDLKNKLTELDNKDVKIYGEYVYLMKDLYAEQKTAEWLVKLLEYKNNNFILSKEECYEEIKILEKKSGFKLNDAQKSAVYKSLSSNLSIITGGPGTGKTTLLKFIIKIFQKNFSDNIKLCSPTGKAARRMAESTGFDKASTIHSLLKITPDYHWSLNDNNPIDIEADLLVIDESSMLDMEMMYLLISSIPFTCKVVFLGDVDQLPSVGAGNVLKEMIESKIIPTSILDKIYRQSEQSNIIKNSHYFNKGETEKLVFDKGTSVTDSFVVKERKEDINKQIADIFYNSYKKSGDIESVQILTPYKKTGMIASTACLNKMIQERINPFTDVLNEIKCKDNIFRVNDRVIQQVNTDAVKNGEVGTIIEIINDNGSSSAVIDFGEDNILKYSINEMIENKIALAYALTVHKSQGSEYKTVIMPCISEHKDMLTKKLVYTAWTRAKEHIILIGDTKTIEQAALNDFELKRNTLLSKRIINQKKKRD